MVDKTLRPVQSVLMLTTSYYPEPPGGAERQLEYLSSYLAKQGIRVTVLTRHLRGLPRFEEKDGYTIIRIPQFGAGKIKTLTFVVGMIISILSRRNSFEILHAHLVYSPAFAAVIAGKLIRMKTIVRFRSSGKGSDLVKARSNIRGLIRMSVIKKWADCHIVLTSEMKNELIMAGYSRGRIVQMLNGVDVDYFSPVADKINISSEMGISLDPKKIILIFTGRLDPSKNIPLLLVAVKKALTICPKIHLLLVGGGAERNRLAALVAYLGIGSSVTFIDSTSKVREYLRLADIFVLPSSDEGISNSMLEAMSCELACIATDVGGAREVFGDGRCGILTEPDNIGQLSDAIVYLASDLAVARNLGRDARQRIINNYSIKAVGNSYIQLYNHILNG